MLHKTKYNNLTLCFKESRVPYNEILEDFVHLRLPICKVFRNKDNTKVMLVQHQEQLYILKVFKPNGKKIERVLKSFFRKDYFLSLIQLNDELWSKGMRFQNDVYLLAQRKQGPYTDLYIMLNEYIPGTVLNEFDVIPEIIKQDLVHNMALLHQHKLISGDAHKGNFILSEHGLRIIDLSGKKFTRRRVAEDRLALESRFNIKEIERDFSYYLLKAKFHLRQKIKSGKHVLAKMFAF